MLMGDEDGRIFLDDQEWRDIPGYPNYEVSEFGLVWNVRHDRLIKSFDKNGYEYVCQGGV